VKGVATVRTLAPWAVLLDDLTTVPLDVAALERATGGPTGRGTLWTLESPPDGVHCWGSCSAAQERGGAVNGDAPARPGEICRELLAALDASEGDGGAASATRPPMRSA